MLDTACKSCSMPRVQSAGSLQFADHWVFLRAEQACSKGDWLQVSKRLVSQHMTPWLQPAIKITRHDSQCLLSGRHLFKLSRLALALPNSVPLPRDCLTYSPKRSLSSGSPAKDLQMTPVSQAWGPKVEAFGVMGCGMRAGHELSVALCSGGPARTAAMHGEPDLQKNAGVQLDSYHLLTTAPSAGKATD